MSRGESLPETPAADTDSDENENELPDLTGLDLLDEPDPPMLGMLEAQLNEMEADDTIDFASSKRHGDGFIRHYIECPDCLVPMARKTVQTVAKPHSPDYDLSESEYHCVCPDCREQAAIVTVEVKKGPNHLLS